MIEPQPMTPEQVADLVRRTRAAQAIVTRRARVGRYAFGLGRSAEAAKWALDNRKSVRAAARHFGLAFSTVSAMWRRLYPGISSLISRRPPAIAPEDECSW